MRKISRPWWSQRILLSVCAVVLLCVCAGATQFRQRIDLVTIDATVVNDRGEPVTDLSSSDFEVLVDGKPRPIVAFRRTARESDRISAGASASDTDDSAANPSERVVVFLVQKDLIRRHEGRSFLEAAADFIDTLDPADRVAVRTIPAESQELWMLRDREALKERLRAIRGTAQSPRPIINVTSDEAVSIVHFRDESTLAEVTMRECSRHRDAGPGCQQEVEIAAKRRYDEIGLRAVSTLRELEHLIQLLSGLDGSKHIVFITTGPQQTPDDAAAVHRVAAAAARARVHIHALQIPHLNEGIDSHERGRPAAPVRQGNSTSYSLATMTGGMAMTPSAPEVTFRRLQAELSAAYELAVEAGPQDRDAKPHGIEVRVTSRRGLSIRARQQFVLSPLPARALTRPTPAERVPLITEMTTAVAGEPVPAVVLRRLGEYVSRFEREFSSAVAEERYVQLIRPRRGSPSWPRNEQALEWHEGNDYPKTGVIVDRRQLLSDVLLAHTPQGWVGYRDVAEVDGRVVRQRGERVSKLFLSRDADRDDQLRRITEESARYNIGGFKRTLNIPTLPLFFMHARNHSRFTFTRAGRERLGDYSTDVIAYEEHQRPTLIGDRAGEDVPIRGRLWIDAQSGAVIQTEIRVVSGERRAARRGTLVTRYGQDPRFTVLVPDYMWEWYDGEVANLIGSAFSYTFVEGLARYANYRKFTVSTTEISR